MAGYQAIAAVCEGIVQLLRANYRPEAMGNNELDFKVYTSQDFTRPMAAGVSLFVYRIFPSGTHRAPAGRVAANGRPQKPLLPLELHVLLTAWAREASLQNTIAGWMMRTLEDTPTLPPAVLNAVWADVFRPDEAVEVVLGELRTEDLIHMWDVLTDHSYQLSVPYVARIISLESTLTIQADEPVRDRDFTGGPATS